MADAFGHGDAAMSFFPAGNPMAGAGLLETLELVRKAWTSFSLPPGLAPTLDPAEIERRIAELKSIEQWLAMNLTMLQGTIQAFEIQQNTLNTLRSFGESSAAAVSAAAEAARTHFPSSSSAPDEAGIAEDLAEYESAASADAPASVDRESAAANDSAAQTAGGAQAETAQSSPAKPGDSNPQPVFGIDPVAWWDLVQKQFAQVASTAMASVPQVRPAQGGADAARADRQSEPGAGSGAARTHAAHSGGGSSGSSGSDAAKNKRTPAPSAKRADASHAKKTRPKPAS